MINNSVCRLAGEGVACIQKLYMRVNMQVDQLFCAPKELIQTSNPDRDLPHTLNNTSNQIGSLAVGFPGGNSCLEEVRSEEGSKTLYVSIQGFSSRLGPGLALCIAITVLSQCQSSFSVQVPNQCTEMVIGP